MEAARTFDVTNEGHQTRRNKRHTVRVTSAGLPHVSDPDP
jgi:hypothetical protein